MWKVIETRYKQCKFRSRLEARWAVFFDALGVRWDYEREGFQFQDGIRYLPDFWLPDLKCWLEVKPDLPSYGDEEWTKAANLAEIGYPVGILGGTPGKEQIVFFVCDISENSAGGPNDTPAAWWPLRDHRVTFNLELMEKRDYERQIVDADLQEHFPHYEWPRDYARDDARLKRAYTAASSAQFEFGKKGN